MEVLFTQHRYREIPAYCSYKKLHVMQQSALIVQSCWYHIESKMPENLYQNCANLYACMKYYVMGTERNHLVFFLAITL